MSPSDDGEDENPCFQKAAQYAHSSRFLFRAKKIAVRSLALVGVHCVLKRKHPKPKLRMLDILFWVVTRRFWSGWKQR
jgi:hypothetical protein